MKAFETRILKPAELTEFKALVEIFLNVFEHHEELPAIEHLSSVLASPKFLALVAMESDQVIGGLTVHLLPSYYRSKPTAYIYDIGVAPEHQGRGIGTTLINELLRHGRENNIDEAYVEAEADDADAIRFYRQTPYDSELKAVHFNYQAK